jgi:hypothetical protein
VDVSLTSVILIQKAKLKTVHRVVKQCTAILLAKKNSMSIFIAAQFLTIKNKISQTEKGKYCMFSITCRIETKNFKNKMNMKGGRLGGNQQNEEG